MLGIVLNSKLSLDKHIAGLSFQIILLPRRALRHIRPGLADEVNKITALLPLWLGQLRTSWYISTKTFIERLYRIQSALMRVATSQERWRISTARAINDQYVLPLKYHIDLKMAMLTTFYILANLDTLRQSTLRDIPFKKTNSVPTI